MKHRKLVLIALALLGLVALGCATVTTGEKPKHKSPYLPNPETLEKASLEMLWHAEVDASDIVKVYLFRDVICLESTSLQFYVVDTATGLIRWQTQLTVPLTVAPCDNTKQLFIRKLINKVWIVEQIILCIDSHSRDTKLLRI